jgi:DTW domain-containing protein
MPYCVCNLIEPFYAHCNVLILQHPRERRRYYSTAKLVLKAIVNSQLLRGIEFPQKLLEASIGHRTPYLLFPSSKALDCREVSLHSDTTIFVLDGTWSEAGKIFRRNPFIQSLACVSFRDALRSSYKIRKQPREGCLSTIESVAYLLALNGERRVSSSQLMNYESLLTGFNKMVEQQLPHLPQ